MNSEKLSLLLSQIRPLKEKLILHPMYQSIKSPQHIHNLMSHHVFAVWDFMSLLKSLQKDLTCVDIPWIPVGNANTRYLINEIVTGEESDINPAGGRISHFELYLLAMQQAGCDTVVIEQLIQNLKTGKSIQQSIPLNDAPAAAIIFLNHTLEIAMHAEPHIKAAVFTFGREDLIPDMFLSLVKELNQRFEGQFDLFAYYLERHIEVDGDHHSKLALEMTADLCGDDDVKWHEAGIAVCEALQSRIELWDAIYISNKTIQQNLMATA
jgi:hypothetical protein